MISSKSDKQLMLELKDMIGDATAIDEEQVSKIVDGLWEIGRRSIADNADSELFYLYIAVTMVGNWKGDGWWLLICEQADLVPYIPKTLEKLNLPELKNAFEDVIKLFPDYTVFKSDDALYCDICNFLQSLSIKVTDERLCGISKDERRRLVKQIRQNVDRLEELTDSVWGENTEYNGWKSIMDYFTLVT